MPTDYRNELGKRVLDCRLAGCLNQCTLHGNAYDVITDGDSFENVVSSNMVEKLKLKTEDHPQSYKLTWL